MRVAFGPLYLLETDWPIPCGEANRTEKFHPQKRSALLCDEDWGVRALPGNLHLSLRSKADF
jgi:hypothetical protein